MLTIIAVCAVVLCVAAAEIIDTLHAIETKVCGESRWKNAWMKGKKNGTV